IGACDSFGLINLRAVTVQLSLLTDAMAQACLAIAAERTDTDPEGFCVLAMGKLGGEELNYSSDIDLIFLAKEDSGRFWSLGQKLIRGLIHPTQSGFLYRVDMRLRPWGNSGPLVATVDSHLDYLRNKAMLWEKQAMLKARVIAGTFSVGQEFLKQAQQYLFNAPADDIRENVRGMKAKIEANLEQKGKKWGEVKSGTGSIRDVEFVAQYLQMIHGGENPQVRSFNTLDALIRLADFSHIHADEYRILTDGYIFLRKIEHQLQLLHNKQVHNLPTDPLELDFLALRLDYQSGEQFLDYYEKHRQEIRRVYERYLGDNPRIITDDSEEIVSPSLRRHLDRMDHEYSISFDDEEIEHHARLAETLDDENLAVVDAELQEDGDWLVTIVAYDFLGELSLICGLFFVHELDIVDVDVFTYESVVLSSIASTPEKKKSRPKPGRNVPPPRPSANKNKEESRKKIVDVFLVRPSHPLTQETWFGYQQELRDLLKMLQAGKQTEAQGTLAKRVAAQLRVTTARDRTLYPVDIEIDNTRSEQFTILSISAPDTIGFLYELANALATSGVDISRVHFKSLGGHAYDLLYVTDQQGRKITDEKALLELRAATVLTKQFTHLLPNSPNPEAALTHFREFMSQFFGRPDWIEELSSLERPEVLDALAKLLGISDFLWSDFLRMQHANLFPVLRNVEDLAIRKNKEELQGELDRELLSAAPGEPRVVALNSWKDRQMFRTDMRHILGHIPEFGQFSSELSDGAEIVVEAACRI
ncbi:MAG: glutamine synthetase adenylyltransferase, partial [Planctomycetaceae bacterium]|nr:glutamine synthetase adenylyltransferase [Planctomycetaceae bacterium]